MVDISFEVSISDIPVRSMSEVFISEISISAVDQEILVSDIDRKEVNPREINIGAIDISDQSTKDKMHIWHPERLP